jgi:hypothetical protein
MARGWESKSVESQQDEAGKGTPAPKAKGKDEPLTAEERDTELKRRVLQLARARTEADLKKATAPAQREMLERALEDLDRTIGALPVRTS